ncbi:MAG: sigma-70 family RNA polymerase sigma factor, partial [Catalinimonas sp.]
MEADLQDISSPLVEQCRRGDRRAQRELYQRYARAMLNAIMRIVHDHTTAEDLLQESFVDAFMKIDQFRGESTFGAWLRRIAVNNALNHLRKYRPGPLLVADGVPEGWDEPPDEPLFPYDVER